MVQALVTPLSSKSRETGRLQVPIMTDGRLLVLLQLLAISSILATAEYLLS